MLTERLGFLKSSMFIVDVSHGDITLEMVPLQACSTSRIHQCGKIRIKTMLFLSYIIREKRHFKSEMTDVIVNTYIEHLPHKTWCLFACFHSFILPFYQLPDVILEANRFWIFTGIYLHRYQNVINLKSGFASNKQAPEFKTSHDFVLILESFP